MKDETGDDIPAPAWAWRAARSIHIQMDRLRRECDQTTAATGHKDAGKALSIGSIALTIADEYFRARDERRQRSRKL